MGSHQASIANGDRPDKVNNMDKTLEVVQRVVDCIQYPGYTFRVGTVGALPCIWLTYNEPDTLTGVVEPQQSRMWVFPPEQTEGQIVQTCFKALLTSLEHRAREHFQYKGAPVLMPHLDMSDLVELAKRHCHAASGPSSSV